MKAVLRLLFLMLACGGISTSQGQWQRTNGPTGDYIYCLSVIGQKIFAGGKETGLFFSEDSANSWKAFNAGIPNNWYNELEGFPTVYSITNLGTKTFIGTASGIFFQDLGGQSWIPVDSGLPNNVWTQALLTSGANIFAGTGGYGMYISSDSGQTWNVINNGLTNLAIRSLTLNGSTIFAGTQVGIFSTSDNGNTWQSNNNGLTNQFISGISIMGTNMFAATRAGVFISSDTGASWSAVNNGLTNPIIMTIATVGTNIFAGTNTDGLFLSTDTGATWAPANNGLNADCIFELAEFNGTTILAATVRGVFRSTNNGMSWTPANNGLGYCRVVSMCSDGTNVFAGSRWLHSTADGGTNWKWNDIDWHLPVFSLATFGRYLLLSNSTDLFISEDSSISWSHVLGGNSALGYELAFSSSEVYAGGTGQSHSIYHSSDTCQNWTTLDGDLPIWYSDHGNDYYYPCNSVVLLGSNIFAGYTNGIFRTTDVGLNWTGVLNDYIRAMTVCGVNLIAGTGSAGVYLSADSGNTWTHITNGLPNAVVNRFIVYGSNVFAGTYAGIYLSPDEGLTWTSVNTGLTDTTIWSFAICGNDIYAGTNAGVWKRELNNMPLNINQNNKEGSEFIIYPNPVSNILNVQTNKINSREMSRLSILNVFGQLMIPEIKFTDRSISLDVEYLNPGVYFLRVKESDKIVLRKFVKN